MSNMELQEYIVMAHIRVFLLQIAGLFSRLYYNQSVPLQVFFCFDIAAWPGYTIPSLFSSFSSNEAETLKKQTSGSFVR